MFKYEYIVDDDYLEKFADCFMASPDGKRVRLNYILSPLGIAVLLILWAVKFLRGQGMIPIAIILLMEVALIYFMIRSNHFYQKNLLKQVRFQNEKYFGMSVEYTVSEEHLTVDSPIGRSHFSWDEIEPRFENDKYILAVKKSDRTSLLFCKDLMDMEDIGIINKYLSISQK